MIPRLITSDIDGTFLDPNHRVSIRNREVVERAVAAGCHFALATGRPYRWIEPVLEQLPFRPLCVTSNGAVIFDPTDDQVLLAHKLTPEVLTAVAEAAVSAMDGRELSFGVERVGANSQVPVHELYVVDEVYADIFSGAGVDSVAGVLSQPCVKLMLRNFEMTSAEMYELINPHIDPQLAHVTYSIDEGILEVAAPGITKATGVSWLAAHYGVEQQDVIAFGDMPNDIEMLRWVGYGVAMGNAAESVKAAADFVTTPNHQAGVAKVLERWF